jgi:transaldolase/glucose-6-phosphate isomerase
MANPLIEVQRFGQSIWYDNIRRSILQNGELRAMAEHDGLLGLTSNPAIFEKAIAGSADYDAVIRQSVISEGAERAIDIYERIANEDIQMAADILQPAYVHTGGRDGYVSLEVSPHLAHDTEATIDEARRLYVAVGRSNLMIKVPATPAGIPAIRQLISEGINVNVTLLFAVSAYEAVANAYLEGLEQRAAKDLDLHGVASVASFFVSRIDTLVDHWLEEAMKSANEPKRRQRLLALRGKVAIANAKVAYGRYQEQVLSRRWRNLADKGARTQRLLWASTSTKNPNYRKTLYVEELIGPDTVNTVPPETFEEFRKSGRVALTLAQGSDEARRTLAELEALGISLPQATDQLLVEAVQKFADPFDQLLGAIEKKRQALVPAWA